MLERRSALAAVYIPQIIGGGGALLICERGNRDLIQVAGWPDTFAALAAVVAAKLGVAAPRNGKIASAADGRAIFRVAPERLWITAPMGDGIVAAMLDSLPQDAIVTEIRHSRTVIRITGLNAQALLNRGLPIDLDPSVFPANGFAQSVMHHIPVLVHRLAGGDNDSFDVYVPREYAVSFWEWVLDAAAPFGACIGERQ